MSGPVLRGQVWRHVRTGALATVLGRDGAEVTFSEYGLKGTCGLTSFRETYEYCDDGPTCTMATVAVTVAPLYQGDVVPAVSSLDSQSFDVSRDASEVRMYFRATRACLVDGLAVWLNGHRCILPLEWSGPMKLDAGDSASLSAKVSPSVGAVLDELVAEAECKRYREPDNGERLLDVTDAYNLHRSPVHPTQYRRAPNGHGYRVLDTSSELALMRQDDGLRVTAPLATVATWTLEDGPETMTLAEQHEARGRLALEWPRAGETRTETLRRVTGSVELPPAWMWESGQPSPWEGAVRL